MDAASKRPRLPLLRLRSRLLRSDRVSSVRSRLLRSDLATSRLLRPSKCVAASPPSEQQRRNVSSIRAAASPSSDQVASPQYEQLCLLRSSSCVSGRRSRAISSTATTTRIVNSVIVNLAG
ncbi:CBS domain containing protein [Sesbania bispinosa]|nr:CBS domain containing protein [Sesbania bispinosa]